MIAEGESIPPKGISLFRRIQHNVVIRKSAIWKYEFLVQEEKRLVIFNIQSTSMNLMCNPRTITF
jgi:hypothetical protein